MIFVSAENAPPADKPYLLSSRKQLADDARDVEKYKQQWLSKHPFPSVVAPKIDWMKALLRLHDEMQEEHFYMFSGPSAEQVAREILLENSPSRILLELYCAKSDLPNDATDVDQELFAEHVATYGNQTYVGAKKWDAYRTWLQDNKHEKVLFAQVDCASTDELSPKIMEMKKLLGLSLVLGGFSSNNNEEHRMYGWGLQEKIGENLYFSPPSGTACVQLKASFQKPSDITKINLRWTTLLKGMEEETKRSGDHKVSVKLPKPTKPKRGRRRQEESDEDEDEEEEEIVMSPDTHYALWLPAFWREELSRMRGHFNGNGESNTIKKRLQKGNTDTGNLTMDILRSEYEYIKSYKSIPKKFVGALALVYAATEDPHWMMDNEFPEEISKIWKQISNYFRTTLLKKTDRELGLGLPNDSVDSEGFSDSRKALYILLGFRAMAFDDIEDYGGKVEFKWKPNKPRKRKLT